MQGEATKSLAQTESGQEQIMLAQGTLRGELGLNSKRGLHRNCKPQDDADDVSAVSTATMLSQGESSSASLCTSSNLSSNANLANLETLKKFGEHEEARLLRRKIGLRELRNQVKTLTSEAVGLSALLESRRRCRASTAAASEVASCAASDLTSLTQREGMSSVTLDSSGLMQPLASEEDSAEQLWRRRLNLQLLREDPFALKCLPGRDDEAESEVTEESDDEAAWQAFRASVSNSTVRPPSELSASRNCEVTHSSLPEQGSVGSIKSPFRCTKPWTLQGFSLVAVATLGVCLYSFPLLASSMEGLL